MTASELSCAGTVPPCGFTVATPNDWTARLAAIAAAAQLIGKSFTIDGEAVVLGPDGLSRFEELSRRQAARTAILYAFDLIEHDGKDLRNRPLAPWCVGPGRDVGNFPRRPNEAVAGTCACGVRHWR